ncbi:MAG TPA: hypothetical protein VNT92_10515 [Acidimicrobiia bacterium]|nr:hypothetical protein [Acidimicrobiia bacterium]
MTSSLRKGVIVLWVLLMIGAAVIWLTFPADIDSMVGILFASVCSVVVGGILTLKVPSNSIGLLSLLAGSAWVLYLFGRGYAMVSLESGESMPLAYFFGWLGSWTGALFLIGVSLVILCFPTGKPVGWWRVIGLGPLIGAASTMVGAGLLWGLPLETLADADLLSQTRWYPLVDAGFILGFVSVIPATLSVIARFRKAGSVERQQIKWLLAATSLLAVAYVVGAMSDDSNEAVWWVVSLAVAAIPISILFAVLRYRLYDIDRILSRTVSYVVVIGVLAGVYLLALTAMTNFLPSDSSLSVAASTLAVAALFNPLRRRVQAWVERRFNRSRYDAQQVMERFSGSLRQDLDPDTVVTGWVGVVSETMQPATAGVWIRNDFGTMER